MSAGRLIVCPTPIGNLEDITLRVLAALREADLVACEDTRRTRILLDRYGVNARLVSYHEHNEAARASELIAKMQSGSVVALVSDAGTPLISDPGYKLVRAAVEDGHAVTALPGASAVLGALSLAGLPTDRFFFEGFLPVKQAGRQKRIAELEGGIGALAVSSGQAALHFALVNLADTGGNIVSVPQLYGTTHTLLAHVLPRQGITTRFADSDKPDAIEKLIDGAGFLRVHRSAIVRRAAVQEVRPLTHGDFELVLAGGAVVRGSRSRRKALAVFTS